MDLLNAAKQAVNNATGRNLFDVASDPRTYFEQHFQKVTGGENVWQVSGEDWYKVYPYQFMVDCSKDRNYFYTLPIPPQVLNIKPIIASKATPTIGGVVEETSPVTFWMIQMSGVFGVGVGRTDSESLENENMATEFRQRISTTGLLSGIASSLNGSINRVGGALDAAAGAIGAVGSALNGDISGGAAGLAGSVTGAINSFFTPPQIFGGSAIAQQNNGFTDAQELSRFIYMYTKLKSMHPDDYTLYFNSFKTKQRWKIIIKDFSLQQSAQNPNMYRYQLALQGWDVKSVDNKDKAVDRFSAKGDLAPVLSFNPASKKQQDKIGAKLGLKKSRIVVKDKNNKNGGTGGNKSKGKSIQ